MTNNIIFAPKCYMMLDTAFQKHYSLMCNNIK